MMEPLSTSILGHILEENAQPGTAWRNRGYPDTRRRSALSAVVENAEKCRNSISDGAAIALSSGRGSGAKNVPALVDSNHDVNKHITVAKIGPTRECHWAYAGWK